MQIQFNSISEPSIPGQKWFNLFSTHWETYKNWVLENESKSPTVDLITAQKALQTFMPEMWPTYLHLCNLIHADEVATKFLTGYMPPFYVSGCSNAVFKDKQIHLVRNYDHHPDLFEGVQLLSKWNHKKVIAISDCLIGVLDGINEDGLVVSLTFGGRKVTGQGFGIPFILRYILEFCSNVEEAVFHLKRIPSHMAYNVTVIDQHGNHKTVRVAPAEKTVVTDAAHTTNHQKKVRWPENAAFNKTVERFNFLKHLLDEKQLTKNELIQTFLRKPLYNNLFKQGFGTLFTAAYTPQNGEVELHWPGISIKQSFKHFTEQTTSVTLQQKKVRNMQTKNFAIPHQGHTAKAITYANPNLDKDQTEKNKSITPEFIDEVWSSIIPDTDDV